MRQLLHISDVHFGRPHLRKVADGVHQLARRQQPDLVVISGDLTQRAKPKEFLEARAFVDGFTAPTLAVPGNHDVPMYRFWERIFTPLSAYKKHFAADLEPVFMDDELLVVGVNTAFNWTQKDGRVTRAGRLRLQSVLADAAPSRSKSDRMKIVVAHHPLVPAPRFDTQRVLADAHAVVDLLAGSDVELVLSGHLHQAWIGSTENHYPSGRRPVLLAHSGTSTSSRGRGCERRRNTCNWIRLSTDEIEISHLDWDQDTGRFHVLSRHHFPRRGRTTYALETL